MARHDRGRLCTERVDGLRALASQQVPRAECHGIGLLVRALAGYKPHGGTLGGLARSASASAMLFFWRLTKGFTYAGAISFTVWPRLTISRPQK